MKKLLSLVMLVGVILVGCKDDDVKIDAKATITGATSGWLIDSWKIEGTEAIDQVLPDACDRDNSLVFAADGKFTVAGNTTKCDPDEAANVDEGTWTLNSDNTQLTITSSDVDGFSIVLTKLNVTATTISGDYVESFLGVNVTSNITLKKK